MNPRAHYLKRLAEGNGLTMYSSADTNAGLPTISVMSSLSAELGGEVKHLGMGCFKCEATPTGKAFQREEAFNFCGGGALIQCIEPEHPEVAAFYWAPLGVLPHFKVRVLKALRKLLPGLPVTRDEARAEIRRQNAPVSVSVPAAPRADTFRNEIFVIQRDGEKS